MAHFSNITDFKTIKAVPLFVANKCINAEDDLCNLPIEFIKKLLLGPIINEAGASRPKEFSGFCQMKKLLVQIN